VTNPEKLLLTLRESNERCSLLHLQIQGCGTAGEAGWLQMAEDEQAGLALLATTLL
jgi:hypothetical protein